MVCWYWDFDAFSTIFLKEKVTILGVVLTGGIVAGGSKAFVKLFRDIMGFKSTAEASRPMPAQAKQKGGTQK